MPRAPQCDREHEAEKRTRTGQVVNGARSTIDSGTNRFTLARACA